MSSFIIYNSCARPSPHSSGNLTTRLVDSLYPQTLGKCQPFFAFAIKKMTILNRFLVWVQNLFGDYWIKREVRTMNGKEEIYLNIGSIANRIGLTKKQVTALDEDVFNAVLRFPRAAMSECIKWRMYEDDSGLPQKKSLNDALRDKLIRLTKAVDSAR